MSTVTINIPVPETVSKFQAKAILLLDGKLEQVETIVAAADPLTQLAFKEADFSRASPLLNSLAAQLEWDNDYLDDLFRRASRIVV